MPASKFRKILLRADYVTLFSGTFLIVFFVRTMTLPSENVWLEAVTSPRTILFFGVALTAISWTIRKQGTAQLATSHPRIYFLLSVFLIWGIQVHVHYDDGLSIWPALFVPALVVMAWLKPISSAEATRAFHRVTVLTLGLIATYLFLILILPEEYSNQFGGPRRLLPLSLIPEFIPRLVGPFDSFTTTAAIGVLVVAVGIGARLPLRATFVVAGYTLIFLTDSRSGFVTATFLVSWILARKSRTANLTRKKSALYLTAAIIGFLTIAATVLGSAAEDGLNGRFRIWNAALNATGWLPDEITMTDTIQEPAHNSLLQATLESGFLLGLGPWIAMLSLAAWISLRFSRVGFYLPSYVLFVFFSLSMTENLTAMLFLTPVTLFCIVTFGAVLQHRSA